jgi:SAM-dependent methyltransferase
MTDRRYVETPPEGADGWREVWREDLQFRLRPPGNPLTRWLVGLFRRLTVRSVEAELERQRNFNLAALDLVRDADVARRGLRGDIEAVQLDARVSDEALAKEIARLRGLAPITVQRNDALIAALDQKIETLAVRMRDAVNPSAIGSGFRVPGSGTPNAEPGTRNSEPASRTSDLLYRRLEDALRGSEAEVRDAMKPYADYARDHSLLVDVGCGRGELLALCREAKVEARGFDLNERSVADLVQRGFDVKQAGIPECFASLADGAVGSVAAIHVVEHLPLEALIALFAEAHRVLRSGGLLMIETPNAESIAMGASDFWRDPTHMAPRHPAALSVLAREHGFSIEELQVIHPFPEANHLRAEAADSPSIQRLVETLNARLFGGQDLRLILKK